MRIAMVMSYLPVRADRGGVSYQVHALANLLVERGHTVVVYSVDDRPGDARYEVRTLPLPRRVRAESGLCHLVFPLLVARQRFDGFDVLHLHGDDFLLWWRRRPCLRTFYGSALGEALSATSWRRALVQALFYPFEFVSGALARRSVAISHATCRHLPFVREVVPCGVDLSRFSPGGSRSVVPSVLFVGMMAGRKQGRRLAQIFTEQVRSQVPEAELWLVVPEPVEGPGLRWLGKVGTDRLVDLYRSAWGYASASTYEGFGLPYLEAMACGTPVVSTPNPGARELLDGGRVGLLADEKALGSALARLLTDAPLRAELAEKGLRHVQAYSLEASADRYEHIYSELAC